MSLGVDGDGAPEDQKRHNNFDLVRLFAAAQVMLSHGIAHLRLPIPSTVASMIDALPGVPIFFVVSGFLITQSYTSGIGLGRYAANRARRIYPALWVNLIGLTAMLAIFGNLAMGLSHPRFWAWHITAAVSGSDYLASRTFGGLFSPEGVLPFYPSGVLWTLPVELSFYLLVPVIAARWIVDRGLLAASVGLWMAVSISVYWTIPRQGDSVVFVGLYLWIFLLGAAARVYIDDVKSLFSGKVAYWLAAHVAITLASVILTGRGPVYVTPTLLNVAHVLTLAGLTLACALTLPRLAEGLLHHRDISYGLYLWHMPVISIFIVLGLTGNWLLFALAGGVSVLSAELSRRFIEEPARRFKIRRSPPLTSPQ